MKKLLTVLLLPFLCLPIACSKSKSKPAIPKYFYHGNPLEMLAGSTQNTELGFDASNYLQFEGYELSRILTIEEMSDKSSDSSGSAEEGNEAPTDLDTSFAGANFSFSELKDNKLTFSGVYQEIKISIDFAADKNGKLKLQSITADGDTLNNLELHHYSETANKRIFSLLFSGKDEEGTTLVALYFVKDQDFDLVKKGDKKYFFTEGQGVMFGWDKSKEVEVNFCAPKGKQLVITGKHASFNIPISMNFVSDWQKALGSRLKLKSGEKNQYPPFSDLNSHCVYILDSYLTEQSPMHMTYGMTLTIPDASKSQIVDGDIFINSKEFAKQLAIENPRNLIAAHQLYYDHFNQMLSFTISHEYGHLLGLDHVFDGTPSIMSYEFDEATLRPFDIESIQYLYQ